MRSIFQAALETLLRRAGSHTTSLAALVACTLVPAAASAAPIDYQMVTVGNPGNAADTTGYGAVGYEYRIGRYDVTIGQYTAFLNAVAATDTYGLYNDRMQSDLNVAGISRSGSPGSYTYNVMAVSGISPYGGVSAANRPITYVSWFDAARFANWMSNGQPTGTQGDGTTETGAYTLNGATGGTAPARNPGAAFSLPTENEWYKAAYYSPTSNAGSGQYHIFATQSLLGNMIGGAAFQANYMVSPSYQYAVTQSSTYSATQNYLTDVGAFTNSASFYGTFDQTGNVFQWNDLDATPGSSRGIRGGDFSLSDMYSLTSHYRATIALWEEYNRLGFRLAGPANSSPVPEIDPAGIGSVVSLLAGALGLLERLRLKRA